MNDKAHIDSGSVGHEHITCTVGDSEEQVLREAPVQTFGRLGKE